MATPLDAVRRDLKFYEKGVYSRSEISLRLICAAADLLPEDLVKVIPGECVNAIRETTRVLPQSAEDVRILHLGRFVVGTENDHQERDAAERKRWFDGATQWHDYFAAFTQ